MKRKALTIALMSALLFSAIAVALSTKVTRANPFTPEYVPGITINKDGNITPETGYISRNGNVYILTSDLIEQYIVILRSNIIFDGAGHNIKVTKNYASPLNLNNVTNVTVRNVEVYSRYISIDLELCSNCLVTNVRTSENVRIIGTYNKITESTTMISMWEGSDNLIIRNNITGMFIGSDFNTFSQNNIVINYIPEAFSSWREHMNFWDDGAVGNYWMDYLTKYPNTSEKGNSEIGDIPYVIGADNVDNFPLMYPWGTPEIALLWMKNATYSGSCLLNFTVNKPTVWMGYSLDGQDNVTMAGNVTLSGLSNGLHNVTVYAEDTFGNEGTSETIVFTVEVPFPTTLVVAASATAIAVVGVGLLVYFRKRKR